MLFPMLRRRPVSVLSMSPVTMSPFVSRMFLICCTVRLGFCAQMSAAAPATCGDDIEVPLKNEYVLPGVVLRMLLPGAATSTAVAPKWVKPVSASDEFVAATAMMFGASKLDG